MKTAYSNTLSLVIVLVMVSCGVEDPQPASSHPLYQKWRLLSIEITTPDLVVHEYKQVTAEYEMLQEAVVQRQNLVERKQFNYLDNGTYHTSWLVSGDYELGTAGERNWQPGIGYFYLTVNEDSIYHNRGLDYETAYAVTILESRFERISYRYMTNCSPGNQSGNPAQCDFWNAGETVTFKEIFIPVIEE